jgi:hypothetical protein
MDKPPAAANRNFSFQSLHNFLFIGMIEIAFEFYFEIFL